MKRGAAIQNARVLVSALITLGACGQAERDEYAGAAPGTGGASGASVASGGSAGFVVLWGTGATRGRGLARDNRPEPPAWLPPLPLGPTGWQASTEPFCDTSQNPVTSLGIWANERGVFASMTAESTFRRASSGTLTKAVSRLS